MQWSLSHIPSVGSAGSLLPSSRLTCCVRSVARSRTISSPPSRGELKVTLPPLPRPTPETV